MRKIFPVFDLHCDAPAALWYTGEALGENSCHVSLKGAAQLERYGQFFAFCTYEEACKAAGLPSPEAMFQAMLADFRKKLAAEQGRILPCRSLQELQQANAQGKAAAFLSLEGPEAIGCDPGRLEALKSLGFIMTTLTWNNANALAGCHLTGEGLSAQGKEFVRRAQALGIIIDVSHLSERAFWDLCQISTAPIVASHSNSRTVCGSSRNLTDEQFQAICQLGGLVGINLYAPFLNDSGTADFGDVKRHIDHFLELGGQGHIALGGDLDGCDVLPRGYSALENDNDLGQYLLHSGMEETLVLDIFYNNALCFLQQRLQG